MQDFQVSLNCRKIGQGTFQKQASLQVLPCLTKRAPDVWDSAAFSSIFLASSFFYSQALSTPAHTQVTQTVGWLVMKFITSINIFRDKEKEK
jgi:hypothetical protein